MFHVSLSPSNDSSSHNLSLTFAACIVQIHSHKQRRRQQQQQRRRGRRNGNLFLPVHASRDDRKHEGLHCRPTQYPDPQPFPSKVEPERQRSCNRDPKEVKRYEIDVSTEMLPATAPSNTLSKATTGRLIKFFTNIHTLLYIIERITRTHLKGLLGDSRL